jgi:hypothetical protein
VLVPLAVLACAGSLATLTVPSLAVRSVCAAILPADADLSYAHTLLRNLAVCGLATSIVLLAWRYVVRGPNPTRLVHWFVWGSVAFYVAASISYWWYVDDDAAISFTFARNLADGDGLIFNKGEPPIEGYSNPLWVVVLAGARVCGADIVYAAKLLGIVLGGGCLLLVGRVVSREHPVSWLAVPLAAATAPLIVWNNSGLENALHGVLLMAVVLLLRDSKGLRGRRLACLVAVLVLLVFSRPEGALFAFAVGVYLGTRAAWRGEPFLPAVMAWVVPGLAVLLLTAFRYWYFGDVLPNTFYAKATQANPLRLLNPLSGGWTYIRRAAEACGWIVAVVPVLLLCSRRQASSPLLIVAAVIIVAQLFFVVSVGGDWMAEFRFITPIVPIVSIVVALGFARLWLLLQGALGWEKGGLVVCVIVAVLMIGPQVRRLILFERHPTTPMQTVARIGQYFVDLADQAGVDEPSLLHHDAGGTSYVAGIRLIDLGGLCDRTVARHRHDREIMRRYLFHEQRPTFIYSAKVFADRIGLETFPEFHADYVPLPPVSDRTLDGYIRRVRRDLYDRVFPDNG